MTSCTPQLLERAKKILPASSDDLLLRGIMSEATDRIVSLKKASLRLCSLYGSMESLQKKIEADGVSPDDHGLYADLLEWKATKHELEQLVEFLETL